MSLTSGDPPSGSQNQKRLRARVISGPELRVCPGSNRWRSGSQSKQALTIGLRIEITGLRSSGRTQVDGSTVTSAACGSAVTDALAVTLASEPPLK
jgi:hypothetical protein